MFRLCRLVTAISTPRLTTTRGILQHSNLPSPFQSPHICRRTFAAMASPTVKLNSGHEMPLVGYGLWKVEKNTADTVYNAIKAGYRLLDGACGMYKPRTRSPCHPCHSIMLFASFPSTHKLRCPRLSYCSAGRFQFRPGHLTTDSLLSTAIPVPLSLQLLLLRHSQGGAADAREHDPSSRSFGQAEVSNTGRKDRENANGARVPGLPLTWPSLELQPHYPWTWIMDAFACHAPLHPSPRPRPSNFPQCAFNPPLLATLPWLDDALLQTDRGSLICTTMKSLAEIYLDC